MGLSQVTSTDLLVAFLRETLLGDPGISDRLGCWLVELPSPPPSPSPMTEMYADMTACPVGERAWQVYTPPSLGSRSEKEEEEKQEDKWLKKS